MVLKKIILLILPIILIACSQKNIAFNNYNALIEQGWNKAHIDKEGFQQLQKISKNGKRDYQDIATFFMADTDNIIFEKISKCNFNDINNDCLKEIASTGITIKMLSELAMQSNKYFSMAEYDVWINNILNKKRTYSYDTLLKITKTTFSTP